MALLKIIITVFFFLNHEVSLTEEETLQNENKAIFKYENKVVFNI